MKNSKLQLMFAGLLICAAAVPAFAQKETREEKSLEISAGELDKSADAPEGQKRVIDKITAQYDVDEGRVQGLRLKHLGYGEIAIVYGLVQNMPRGIRDENLYRVVALRKGPPVSGWGNVAKELGLKLGPVVRRVRGISSVVREQEKMDKAEKDKKAEEEKENEKKDKMAEKMDRPGKTVNEGIMSLPGK
jgi:hypothetical protein